MVDTVMRMKVPSESVNAIITNAEHVVQWPKRNERPISEFTQGYFSMAHPNLFCTGKADITVTRIGKKPEFTSYIKKFLR